MISLQANNLTHQKWEWPKESLMYELQILAKGGWNASKNFEKAMTAAFALWLRNERELPDDHNSFGKVFRQEVQVGEAAAYSSWKQDFPDYQGLIAKTRTLTNYMVDAVFYPSDKKETWVIETQFELDYEAVGQALAYEHAFRQVRDKASTLKFSNERLKKKTEDEAKLLQGREKILPKIVCFAAPDDFRALCLELRPQIQVFYCEEANKVSPYKWNKARNRFLQGGQAK